MDYYVKSVIPIIESNYENFTALEKNIADFFMKNEEKIFDCNSDFYLHYWYNIWNLFQKLRYQDLQKNVDFEAIENLFINMRNHLKRKIKNSRDIQEPC